MDFHRVLQVASMKQSHTEKKKNPAKVAKEKRDKAVSSSAVKDFLKKQAEEEKRKAEEAKQKKLELLKKRVEANTQKKVESKPKVDKDKEIFDMNDDEVEKLKQAELNKQSSEDFKGLKISDFDFETKKDRRARAPTDAALMAKQKLERIKEKMKGCDLGDRMAEIDRELSDDEKNPKIKPQSSEKDRDRHSSSKHRSDKHHSSKHSSSSKHKSKHHDRDRDRHKTSSSHSKSSSKPLSISKPSVSSDSDISDISDISLEPVKPTPKPQGWVSVKKKTEEKPKPKVVRPKNNAPPPPSFAELMAIAQQKAGGPMSESPAKKNLAEIPKKKKEDRPLTQEEKERRARTSTKEYQDWIKYGKRPPKEIRKPINRASLAPHPTRPGVSANSSTRDAPVKPIVPHPSRPAGKVSSKEVSNGDKSFKSSSGKNGVSSSSYKSNGARDSTKHERNHGSKDNRDSSKSKSKSSSSPNNADDDIFAQMKRKEEELRKQQEEMAQLKKLYEERMKQKSASSASSKPSSNSSKPHSSSSSSNKPSSSSSSSNKPSSSSSSKPSSSSASRPQSSSSKSTSVPSSARNGITGASKRPRHDISDDEDAAPPPSKIRIQPEKHVNPWDRIYNQIEKRNPRPKKKPQIEEEYFDEDDEYDSEMDDFIDDGGDDAANYSKHIRGIFGYDKRKFRNERDDDLRGMEANFAQISKEEARSARLGMREDLEDIKREEAELKRKRKR